MKNKTKILLATSVLGTSLMAQNYSQPTLYKDAGAMGMGGTNVALGGSSSAIFYNPAGLSKIPKEYGVELQLINSNISINENILDFVDDMDEASSNPPNVTGDSDTDESLAVLDVVDSYVGENVHFDASNFTSYGQKFDKLGISIGAVMGADVNFQTHRPLDRVLETQGLAYGGAALGLSWDFDEPYSVGVGFKQLQTLSWDHQFSLAELLDNNDDLGTYIEDEVAQESSSTTFDLGGLYEVDSHINLGASLLNIGGIGEENGVYIPMTLNLGASYSNRTDGEWLFNQYRLSVDYIDVANAYDTDTDPMKRLRAGAEINIFDGWLSTLALRAGVYQASPTYGFDFRFSVLKIAYSQYTEELGAYAGQSSDTRHIVNLTIGF
ncbi:MAG: hypothetical protein U9R37_09215 [Campylobacterota bacterium]|nr:hypothetical protein [Campylobacterota bacterium]